MGMRKCFMRGGIYLGFFLLIAGCATQGTRETEPSLPFQAGERNSEFLDQSALDQSASAGASEIRRVELKEVRVEGAGEETQIIITATEPLEDYKFEKVDSNRFSLDLREVKDPAALPDLPVGSDRVALSYSIEETTQGIRLLGFVKNGYERYGVKGQESDLVVTFSPNLSVSKSTEPGLPAPVSANEQTMPENRTAQQPLRTVPAIMTSQHGGARIVQASAKGRPIAATPMDLQASDSDASFPGHNGTVHPSGLLRKPYTGKPISLDLLDADVRNVLRLLSDITGTNLVIEPDVSGKVTLKVEQVPWDHVLDMVLAMNGLGQEREGNVIRIARDAKLKEEWSMRAEAIRAKQALMEIAKDVGELATVFFTINYAQPEVIARRIEENKGERGRVSIDERTSLVIYSDTPARIADARQLIARLDKPTAQVMIEARIVTMNSKSSKDLGITWGLATDTPPSSNPRFQVNVPLGAIPSTFDFNIGRMIANDFIKLDARIAALESLGDVRIIAAPNVMTLNNVAARITQGTQIPYLKLNQEGVTSTEFKDATVELEVTPHITPDRRVRLKIMAKQDEPGLVFNGQTSIDKREINTELLVEDGEIVVIGGVTRDRLEKSMDGTPGFNKVPVLGRLFKTESNSSDKNQLLIFISPKVIDPNTMARR